MKATPQTQPVNHTPSSASTHEQVAYWQESCLHFIEQGNKYLNSWWELWKKYEELEAAYKVECLRNGNEPQSILEHKTNMTLLKGGKYGQKEMSPHCSEMSPHCVPPKQYDPNDGQAHEFAKGGWSDAQQIEVLNRHISAQNKVIATKNDLIRTKDELLAAKDQTIAAQNEALKLLEGQINATTALIEQLTLSLGNDAKKRPERADARDASDVGAR